MLLLSHVGDGTVESCWRWCCQDDVSCGVMSLLSHAGNDIARAMLAVV
jgi:hypothetical protein